MWRPESIFNVSALMRLHETLTVYALKNLSARM
jgi:hypothetical protein